MVRCWRALELRDLDGAVAAVLRLSHAANRIPSSVLLGNVHCPMHVAALLSPAIDDLLSGNALCTYVHTAHVCLLLSLQRRMMI